MLKFAREMFALNPDIKIADFHERALFNHILASINPESGQTSYMVPVGQGVTQEAQRMFADFTCCVGTGMESHALHGYGIYYESGDKLWINLFAPSVADWKSHNATLEMETSFPEGDKATLKVTTAQPKEFTLAVRRPYWAGNGFSVSVNGDAVNDLPKPGSYVEIKRTWKTGDAVSLTLPKALWKATLVDNPDKAALMWGPLVLAGDMNSFARRARRPQWRANGTPPNYPVFVTDEVAVDQWLTPVDSVTDTFKATGRLPGDGSNAEVTFIPFYLMHGKRYGIYWDVMSTADWDQRHSVSGRSGEATKAHGRDHRLRAAGRNATRARFQLSSQRGFATCARAGSNWPPREYLVFVRLARRR